MVRKPEEDTHEVVEREGQPFDLRVHAVHKVVHREAVRLVDGLGACNRLQHGTDDDIGADDGEIEDGLVGLHQRPCGLLGEFLRRVVPEHRIARRDGLGGGYLVTMSESLLVGKWDAAEGAVPGSSLSPCMACRPR